MRVGKANGQDWLRLSEAATALGVSLNTLRRWSDTGKLVCYRSPGGHRRYQAVGDGVHTRSSQTGAGPDDRRERLVVAGDVTAQLVGPVVGGSEIRTDETHQFTLVVGKRPL